MAYNPFAVQLAPLEEIDPERELVTRLQRSVMWDLIGPSQLRKNPEKFGQQPASDDVLDKEHEEMVLRKHSLNGLGVNFPMLTHIAVESASQAWMATNPKCANWTPEEMVEFRINQSTISTSVTATVVAHMLQHGLIHIGGHQ